MPMKLQQALALYERALTMADEGGVLDPGSMREIFGDSDPTLHTTATLKRIVEILAVKHGLQVHEIEPEYNEFAY